MNIYEAKLRRAAAELSAERAPAVAFELMDVICGLLDNLPPHYFKETVDYLLARTYRVTSPSVADDERRPSRLELVVDNTVVTRCDEAAATQVQHFEGAQS